VDSKSGETLSVHNPVDDSLVVDKVQAAGPDDVDRAVEAATHAFKKGEWSKFTGSQRAACMLKFADLFEENSEKLAMLETVTMGQPIGVATKLCSVIPGYWRYFAGHCDKLGGESFPEDGDGQFKLVQYVPYGVCAGIAAWNATLLFTAWKIAP
jgi:aldehyde dehydrogenase (NAD+)